MKKRAPPSPAYSPSTNALFTMNSLKVPDVTGVRFKRHDHRLSPASRANAETSSSGAPTQNHDRSKVTNGYRCPIEQHLAHRGSASSSRIRNKKKGSKRSSNQNAFLMNLQKFRASPKAVMEIKQQTSKKVAEAIAEMENKKNNSSSEMLWSPTNLVPFSPDNKARDSVFFPSDDEGSEVMSSMPFDAATVEAIKTLELPTPKNSVMVEENKISPSKKEEKRNHGKWTKAEDNRLSECVRMNNAKDWKKIASMLGTNRTSVQCLHRYNKVLKPGLKKGPWTPDEDKIVFESVMAYVFYVLLSRSALNTILLHTASVRTPK